MESIDYASVDERPIAWPEGAEALNGLQLEEQLRWFVYDEDGRSAISCELLSPDAVYVHEGRICGICLGQTPLIIGREVLLDSESENNGAGYKTRDFYARLRLREPGPREWWRLEGDTLYITARQPELGDDETRPWSGNTVRRAVVSPTAPGVGEYVLANSPDLEEVVVEEGPQKIADCAFRGCPKLRRVDIAESVGAIGVEAFYRCPSLELAVVRGPVRQATFPGAYTAFEGRWGKLTIRCHQGSQLEEYARAIRANVEYL